MKMQVNFLKNLYLTSTVILLCLVVATPFLVRSGISVIEEEYVEAILIILIFIVGYILFLLYRREAAKIAKKLSQAEKDKEKVEDRLTEAFKYIGGVNVQIDTIRSLFAELKEYPQNKQEMKQAMKFLANKILSIIAADWVLLRIIDLSSQVTLREYTETRGSVALIKHEISNKNLVQGQKNDDYSYITSRQNTFNIKLFCIFPKIKVSQQQQIILRAMVNQLEMLFLIFNSKFYKYRNNIDNQ